MRRGYVKLWRKSQDSGMMANANLWLFWTWCLMKASHKKTTVLVGYQNVELDPGQFIFGRRKAASTLNLSEMVVRRCLESLKIAERITIKITNKYSIISIINWELYQSDDIENNQQDNQQQTSPATSNEPATSQQRATNKNVKECKRNNKTHSLGKTLIPPNFKITPEMQAWFDNQKFQRIEIGPATDQFVDYWKSQGKAMKDWTATWRNGMRNAEKWASEKEPIVRSGIPQPRTYAQCQDAEQRQQTELLKKLRRDRLAKQSDNHGEPDLIE